jgi:hypothetical protein
MELLIAFVIILAILVLLDIVALKRSGSERRSGWVNGYYDPREEWHPRNS